jgi:hypothetical protein
VDDLQKFQSDLNGLLNDLIAQSQRQVHALNGVREFLHWLSQVQGEADRMIGHFAEPPQPIQPEPEYAEEPQAVPASREEQIFRLKQALERQGD